MVQDNTTAVTLSSPHDIEENHGAKLTAFAIASITEQMELAEKLVNNLLHLGIDYGTMPGVQGTVLWDPGAAKIIRAFQCHAAHKILFHEETDDLVSWTIEAQLINPDGEIVGSGLGNASTREVKFGKRWVYKQDALREGYTEDDLEKLKTKLTGDTVKYHIHNPECGDLVHTLLVMASKRAEVDAAKSLPGVGAALRVKFDSKVGKTTGATESTTLKDDMTLPVFWATMKGSGLTDENVHALLKTKSMKDWIAAGKTLREAASVILKSVMSARESKASKKTAPPPENIEPTTAFQVTQEHITNTAELIHYANKFFNMTEEDVFRTLHYGNRDNFLTAMVQTPYEAWQSLVEEITR